MSEVKVNKISPRTACGTVTLGDSGDTFTIPSGATITNAGTASGFGATGAVNWDTASIKTAGFSAVSGNGYFCNTNGGIFTVTLPAGAAGNIVAIADYTRTFNTNNLTVTPDGSEKIGGVAASATLNVDGQSATFVYVDSTEGWVNVQETQTSQTGTPPFIAATGGTPCAGETSGDYKYHTFTGPGTFCVSRLAPGPSGNPNNVDYLVVAGGGGGGADYGAGGGAGGYRESVPSPAAWTASPIANPGNARPVSIQGYPIAVGAAGTAGSDNNEAGGSGGVSSFSDIPSAGGGGGAAECGAGITGGSGGGGSYSHGGSAGNTPPTSPAQGFGGGDAKCSPGYAAGGGGGATTVGETAPGPSVAGAGGTGATTCISATPTARSGGGGGGGCGGGGGSYTPGAGGTGGGGAGAANPGGAGTAGTINTGGGGGGGNNQCKQGGLGASGLVILRYKFQ
jgi:hypothetical protein